MAMKRVPLSRGESVVAGAVWRLGNASLGEIHEEVLLTEEMEYATVQSYIRRLVEKDYLKSKKIGRNNIYSPKGDPKKAIGQTLEQMLKGMFAGDAMPIFRHLIQERGISNEELVELRLMIEDAQSEVDDA